MEQQRLLQQNNYTETTAELALSLAFLDKNVSGDKYRVDRPLLQRYRKIINQRRSRSRKNAISKPRKEDEKEEDHANLK